MLFLQDVFVPIQGHDSTLKVFHTPLKKLFMTSYVPTKEHSLVRLKITKMGFEKLLFPNTLNLNKKFIRIGFKVVSWHCPRVVVPSMTALQFVPP